MAKSLADLTAAIAANTAATNSVVAAFQANTGDFTTQVDAVNANTAKLNALVTPAPPPAQPITAAPPTIALNASNRTQQVVLTEANGQPNSFAAVSANTSIATVTPANGPGPFTVALGGATVTGTTQVTFTDQQGNSLAVPVTAS